MIGVVTKHRLGSLVGTLLLAIAAGAAAQAPVAAELLRLERYLGSWTYEGEDKTPGTGGKVTCTAARRWISGGSFVESHRTCDTPRGRFDQVEIFGFDFRTREYTYVGYSGAVASAYRSPSMEGNSVTWTGTGASLGNRCTEVFAADQRSSTNQCETGAGDSFVLRSEGRYQRVD
jgi:hypothetical protein